MSSDRQSDWFNKTPQWCWYSLIPWFGGGALIYAGNKTNKQGWMVMGAALVAGALVLGSWIAGLVWLVWLVQVAIAFHLKPQYLIAVAPKGVAIKDIQTAQLMAAAHGQVDINTCSQDDLVYRLNLPIVYANDIEMLRQEGYIFTDVTELTEVVGIPEHKIQHLEPLITFSYDIKKEAEISWRRLNTLGLEDLIICGVEPAIARKIILERQNGHFSSVLDVKKRTGIPVQAYKHLI